MLSSCSTDLENMQSSKSPPTPSATINKLIPAPTDTVTKPLPSQQLPVSPQPNLTPTLENPEMTPPNPGFPNANLDTLIGEAIQDLAQRLGIEEDQIIVLEAKEVVWSNGSLGCPQPGMVYADVLTPGYLIRLSANNLVFEYHASRGTQLIYCPNPQPPASGEPGNT